ncbi:MAG: hypothetical protein ABIQ95_03905 [Bdellovibrionia bacterium]
MNTNKNFSKISAVTSFSILASILAIGCGGAPQPILSANNTQTPVTVSYVDPMTTTSVPTANLNGAYNYSFDLQNSVRSCNNGGTPTPSGISVGSYSTSGISTDNVFKVEVTSGSPTAIPCTGYVANYSCLQFKVTVGSRSEDVKVSYGSPQSGPCAGVPSTKTLNFNDQASVGHGPLAVVISQPKSDNCRAYGSVLYTGCPMAPIYDNQIVSGTLGVITNHQ